MAEHAFDHEQSPQGGNGESPEPAGNASLSRDHLQMMSLIYTRTAERGRPGTREGYASLDSLREASGLSARRVWEVVDHLQELDLVSCIWDSRALKDSSSSAQDSQKNSGDQRFLRGTQARLTDEGRSYPPLLEFRSQREHKQERGSRSSRSFGSSESTADHRRDRRQDSAWPDRPETTFQEPQQPQESQQRASQPVSGPDRPQYPQQQPPRGYHVFRPREQAARRLVFLVCAFCLALLVVVIFSILALT